MTEYRCIHCREPIQMDAKEQPIPCPNHPEGEIETVPVSEEPVA